MGPYHPDCSPEMFRVIPAESDSYRISRRRVGAQEMALALTSVGEDARFKD
jgi:hypothetical protein